MSDHSQGTLLLLFSSCLYLFVLHCCAVLCFVALFVVDCLLLLIQCVVDPDTGAPTDELLVEAKQALSALGVKYEKVSEVVAAKDEKVDKAIMDGIGVYNENHAVSRAQKVQKYYLLDTDFSVPGEELGEYFEIYRHTDMHRYRLLILNRGCAECAGSSGVCRV